MASKRKQRRNVFRLLNKETGEHYTIRLSREAYDKLKDKKIKKYDAKQKKHVNFEVKKVGK